MAKQDEKVVYIAWKNWLEMHCLKKCKYHLKMCHLSRTCSWQHFKLFAALFCCYPGKECLVSRCSLVPFADCFVIWQLLHCVSDDSVDPFWPALHCFMVILDRLGSKVWGQLIDPIEAFQTIINNGSYNREIQNIRNSSVRLVQLMCQDFKQSV